MKLRMLAAGAACAVPGLALAQSVTLYGVIKAWLYAARGTYAFSKRTSVYATADYIDNRGSLALSVSSGAAGANPVPGGNQLGAMVGVNHIF